MNFLEMKKCLDKAAADKNKIAMVHYLSLKYADQMMNEDPKQICKLLGVKESYATEIRKMRALHLLMKAQNLSL